ncbi:hypothetical protein KHS38_17705 [Mucilaginibacter sp. Bleaf8]|uniref:hypothetical protein n=1 Tax=Mucilaginibacter sp. Bleaf8 TaxID=2834430 RepID=UPI001BCD0781|nr:hypothetical protein [Mucilaginibacter sp. Bleaf8]MBS7566248.1 hypothetical protein [Mucilaginibacter sp. Bleaf8]
MDSNENIKKEVTRLQQSAGKEEAIDAKLDELVALLAQSDIDSDKIKDIRLRVNEALDNTKSYREQIAAFQQIDTDENASRAALLDEFSILLSNNQIDSNISRQYLRGERLSRFFLILISLVMIALGFAMIIMPAPPYFEMFTIYYFTPDDGVTLMDLISLLIILSGIFLLIRSIYKKVSPEK